MISWIKILSFVMLLHISYAFAQQITISGDVRDKNTHQKIPNVNISIRSSQLGTTSDGRGRFSLIISNDQERVDFVFQHIGYDPVEIALDSILELKTIFLQPRVIPLSQLKIEAVRDKDNFDHELPQAITVLRSEKFASCGFVDAADFLNTNQSVQVEENVSGKKNIGIRGSNADDVLVLYNGIKLNSAYDNMFDLSLINLEDMERLEIIRGGQTSVFGSGGFAGVVNIVPKIERDYFVRFQQRMGTYNAGSWGLSFYKNYNGLHAAYGFQKGASSRKLSVSTDATQFYLQNEYTHHTANLNYRLNGSLLSATYLRSVPLYKNELYREHIGNTDQLVSVKYEGSIYKSSNWDISISNHDLKETQYLNNGSLFYPQYWDKHIDNNATYYSINKKWLGSKGEISLAYQLEDASLYFKDEFDDLEETYSRHYEEDMTRRHHGVVLIGKLYNQLDSLNIPVFDMDISIRSDYLTDSRMVEESTMNQNWNQTTVKFSSNLEGQSDFLVYRGYFNYGKNVKFPTMLQQVSAAHRLSRSYETVVLEPEISNGYDLGMEISGEILESQFSELHGWQLTANLFKNFFTNKLRVSYTPGFPLAFYDNVATAQITGFETGLSLFLLNKKVTLNTGFSKYNISDKAAFPFKYDQKITAEVSIHHQGYLFHVLVFREGKQTGRVRNFEGGFDEVMLPNHFNLDAHFKKQIEMSKIKILLNASVRNILNKEVDLVGLALRDRRLYLTAGVAY